MIKKTYGGSAFNRAWKKHGPQTTVFKSEAKFWFHEGIKELIRIQCEKSDREKRPKSSNPPPSYL